MGSTTKQLVFLGHDELRGTFVIAERSETDLSIFVTSSDKVVSAAKKEYIVIEVVDEWLTEMLCLSIVWHRKSEKLEANLSYRWS